MSYVVEADDFRVWAGIGNNIPDQTLRACLDEAEASISADLGQQVQTILEQPRIPIDPDPVNEAAKIIYNEELRRAQRFLARRNSPEGLAGAGDLGYIAVPTRDPDSQYAINRLRALLRIDEGVA